MLVIVAWTATLSFIYFSIAKKCNLLRVSLVSEVVGLDISVMGASKPQSIIPKVESRLGTDTGKVRFARVQRMLEAEELKYVANLEQ